LTVCRHLGLWFEGALRTPWRMRDKMVDAGQRPPPVPALGALFLLLIAVVAALAYSIARSSRFPAPELRVGTRNQTDPACCDSRDRIIAHLEFTKEITALLVIDPYNEFISAGPPSIDNRTARIRTLSPSTPESPANWISSEKS
jgi:hypothetical protein